MKKRLFLFLLIVAFAFVSIYLYFSRPKKNVSVEGEIYVVKRGNVTHFTEQTGVIKPQVGSIVKVGTRATGTLVKLNYQVGDFVRKGALIAKIDDREIRANMEITRAQIETMKKEIEQKEVQYAYAKTNYEREKRLLEKDFTTKDKVDLAKRDMDVLALDIESLKSKIKEAEEKLKALQVNLSYTEIYAPISGIVTDVATQEGETVVAGLSAVNLITIVDPKKLELRIYVDETEIGRVKKGMRVEYWVDAYRDKILHGTIDTVYLQPEVKENIVYYLAIVKIPPEDALILKPDMTAHARIIIREKSDVLVVPNEAIVFEGGRFFVFVKKGEKTEKRPVVLGIRDDQSTEIVSGLSEGEKILISKKVQTPKK